MKTKDNGTTPAVDVEAARTKVWAIQDALRASLAERDDAVECLLAAFCCQEHVVFEGPPGTAKSLAVDALMRCVSGGTYVRRLMHKFATVDELVGPMDLAEFQQNKRFRRVLSGGACAAEGVFLDEIFKSNSAVLNALLSLLEERIYSDQAGLVRVPLRMCASASNEFPEDASLGALYDRFLFRCRVEYIADKRNLRDLLVAKAGQAKAAQGFAPPATLSVAEWDAIAADVDRVKVGEPVIDRLLDLRDALGAVGVVLSDRRAVKLLRALKAAAWLDGQAEVDVDHLQILRFVVWDTPEQQEKAVAILATVERTGVAEAIGEIDTVLRAYAGRPSDPTAYREAIPALLAQVVGVGKHVRARLDAGEFGRRGADKVRRRIKELGEAHQSLKADFQVDF